MILKVCSIYGFVAFVNLNSMIKHLSHEAHFNLANLIIHIRAFERSSMLLS